MGIFSRKEKRKPQVIDIDNEINRISKYMREYEGKIETISVDKIFITERDYNKITSGMTKLIVEIVEEQSQSVDVNKNFPIISRGQNIANRIITKLYDVDWIY